MYPNSGEDQDKINSAENPSGEENSVAENKDSNKNNVKKEILSWVKTLGFALILAIFMNTFIISNASILSGSMENTIMTNDRVIYNRLSYVFSEPKRYDIVLFNFPYDQKPIRYAKRIIGLPGETVEIIEGKVYINNSQTPLIDSFTKEIPRGSYGPFEIPAGCYFMLGDNRNDSYDSKSWDIHYVAKDTIIGKAMFTYYPEFVVHHSIEEPEL